MKNALALALAALFAASLAAQPASLHRISSPTKPLAAVWDATLQRTVFFTPDLDYQQWEWDGAALEERHIPLPDPFDPWWIGPGPLPGQLTMVSTGGTRMHTFDGAVWTTHQVNVPASGLSFAWDESRQRIVGIGQIGYAGQLFEWDGASWSTVQWSSGMAPRDAFSIAYDPGSQRVVLYGGGTLNGPTATVYADFWGWDGSTWAQIDGNAAPGTRTLARMAFSPALGELILSGGFTGYLSSPASDTWRLNGSTWQAIPTVNYPGPFGNALVPDPLGLVLTMADCSMWRFDGTDWSPVHQFPRPSVDPGTTAAYDPIRNQSLLFGRTYNDGQLFDTSWRIIDVPVQPGEREHAGMSWSAADQGILLFGGFGPTGMLADTWIWDGAAWAQRLPAQSPGPRNGFAMAVDPIGGVLLFGGWDFGTTYGDHWRWDGTNWQQVAPATLPAPSARASAALDTARSHVVMVTEPAAGVLETWEWNGVTWTSAGAGPSVGTSPFVPPLAFDPMRGRVVALGDTNADWNGATWTQVAGTPNPAPRPAAAVTDLSRGRLLAFGSGSSVAQLTDEAALVEPVGSGCAIGQSPVLHAMQDPRIGNAGFAIDVTAITAAAPAFLVLGFDGPPQPLGGGCTQYVAQPIVSLFAFSGPNGHARYPVPIPNDAGLRGVEFLAQAAIVDPPRGLIGPLTISHALRVRIGD